MKNITISQAEYELLLAQKQALDRLIVSNQNLQQQFDYLLEQLKLAKQKQYGRSSEKSDVSEFSQLSFFDEAEVYADPAQAEPSVEQIQSYQRKRKVERKERIPSHLPIEIIDYTLDDLHCPQCQSEFDDIGVQQRDTIKIIPATVCILRERAHRYICRCCEQASDQATIVEATLPPAFLARSIASPETVAHIMTQKFQMALPLYRQEQAWQTHGIPISRQTMSNWLLQSSEQYLKPLMAVMRDRLCQADILHADETTLQVLHEPGKTPQQKSYMWVYRSGIHSKNPFVLYDYQPDRRKERPKAFLEHFRGYLHVDGYAAYKTLPATITVVGCWAHARRKFDEALKVIPAKHRKETMAYEALKRCDALFGMEGEAKELEPQARHQLRQDKAQPCVDAFFAWLKSLGLVGKTLFVDAVNYCLNQERALRRYLEDGHLEISNNLAERSIKPFVIGRKNFLFSNSVKGAVASANIYSLVETAKANAINPYDYLCWVLKIAPSLDLAQYPERAAKLLPACFPIPS